MIKPFIFYTDGPVFGRFNGISWIPGVVFVDGTLPEPEKTRVIGNETVHQYHWLELLIVGYPPMYLAAFIRGKMQGKSNRQAYIDNVFEKGSRKWELRLTERPLYDWATQ